LGTSVHLYANGIDVGPARAAVERVLADVDAAYSRFRPDSELQVAQATPRRDVRLSPLLTLAIDTAMRAARATGGAVDPTIGQAMRAIGYDDDFSRIVDRAAPIEIRLEPVPGWRAVHFDRRARTIRLPAGVELDLGSTGKALAADLAAAAALAADLAAAAALAADPAAAPALAADLDGAERGGVLVSLGGDIATAGRAPAGGWRILAAEDSETPPDAEGEVISIDGGAVATSSTWVRRWRSAGGTEIHHLIDPQTGGPVDGPWRTASVVADTCVDANVAATAAIVLGARAIPWLQSRDLPARLVSRTGEVTWVGRWPAPLAGSASRV
ncbi:MAG TPA: FAD:protein FMN transferase, partial [Candidatus Limnocylindrales bacterium]|nr:FAD:protein FMN transferase [Candidatus Limnocylindrales bacterium]